MWDSNGSHAALQQLSGARRGPQAGWGAGRVRFASKAELAHRTLMKIWDKIVMGIVTRSPGDCRHNAVTQKYESLRCNGDNLEAVPNLLK